MQADGKMSLTNINVRLYSNFKILTHSFTCYICRWVACVESMSVMSWVGLRGILASVGWAEETGLMTKSVAAMQSSSASPSPSPQISSPSQAQN